MAHIEPFRALRYNADVVPNLAAVVTPPYDVISSEAQARFYARHPHNYVRLILARDDPPDADGRDRYDRSARAYAAWRQEGVLQRDPVPAVYLYEQVFELAGGERLRRRGFLAGLRLEKYERGVVYPHERTFSSHKDDRLRLMRACPANLEAILAFYAGPAGPLAALFERHSRRPPTLQVADDEGVANRVWPVTDPAEIGGLRAMLADQPVFIADGHHRYETALTYRNERRRARPSPADPAAPEECVLANLIHAEDPGLVILPTHRVFRQLPQVRGPALRERLVRQFRIAEIPRDAAGVAEALRVAVAETARAETGEVVCVLALRGEACLRLTLRDEAVVKDLLAAGHPPAYAGLPVAILHRLLIEEILGIGGPGAPEDAIQYTRDAGEALSAVEAGRAEAALFLTPPRVADVRAVALAGGRMPHKSTYFYPKVLSGLVIRPLD